MRSRVDQLDPRVDRLEELEVGVDDRVAHLADDGVGGGIGRAAHGYQPARGPGRRAGDRAVAAPVSTTVAMADRSRHGEDPTRLADEDLLGLVERGDDRAFAALYDRHGRVAYSLAYRLLGNREAAEDLVQDTFLAVWRAPSTYSAGRGSVRTWILAIRPQSGRWTGCALRGRCRRRQEALETRSWAPRPAPRRRRGRGARAPRPARCGAPSRSVPASSSRCCTLAYYGGFTHQEIADASAPLGTVRADALGCARQRNLDAPDWRRVSDHDDVTAC